jgi:hypothetical protein
MNNPFKLDTSAFPKELDLLLHWLSSNPAQASARPSEPPWNTYDLELFLELARFHRVYPFLYAQLKDSDAPAAILQPLKTEYRINTFQMLHLTRALDQLFRSLGDNGIPALLLKGPALAKDLYGDTSLRTCKDLDILIPPEHFDPADHLLQSSGFTPDDASPRIYNWKKSLHHCSYTNQATGIQVEIHWKLQPGSWPEPTFEELWSRKQDCFHQDHPVYRPGNEDLLLYLSLHGARHSWFRLRWLLDIRQLLQKELDWRLITRLLKQQNCHIATGQALILCNQLLGTLPDGAMQRFTASAASQSAAQTAACYIAQMQKPDAYALKFTRYLLSLLNLRQKFTYLKTFYYPSSQDALTLPLPSLLHFLYFPIRPLLLLWRRLKYKTRAREL